MYQGENYKRRLMELLMRNGNVHTSNHYSEAMLGWCFSRICILMNIWDDQTGGLMDGLVYGRY